MSTAQVSRTEEGDLINAALLESLLQGSRCAPAALCRLQNSLAVHACLPVSHLQISSCPDGQQCYGHAQCWELLRSPPTILRWSAIPLHIKGSDAATPCLTRQETRMSGRWAHFADLQRFLLRSNRVIDWQHPPQNRTPISSDQADLRIGRPSQMFFEDVHLFLSEQL